MFVEMLQNVGTAEGSYVRGTVYSLPDRVAADFIRAGHTSEATEPQVKCQNMRAAMKQLIANAGNVGTSMQNIEASLEQMREQLHARLKVAARRDAIFLPFVGEIGWLIMWHMRFVHFAKAGRKIVCCQRGQECLFPSADEFFYDWTDPVNDAQRVGTGRESREWPEIAQRFGSAVKVPAGGLTMDQELIPLCLQSPIPLKPRIERGLKVDVCIGVRARRFLPAKNYPHWQTVAAELRKRGLTYAVIGCRETSYALDGMHCMSGDFGDWDAAVELLQNCRVFAGTDSGGAHLASAVRACPMVVQQVPSSAAGTTRCFIPRMAATTTHHVEHLPVEAWSDPQAIIDATLRALEV